MNHERKIKKLRSEGKSYRDIENELGCSRSLIAYHLNKTTKKAAIKLQTENRFQKRFDLKEKFGGKCNICGYSKCLAALHFHHVDSKNKSFCITDALWGKVKASHQEILDEAEKCILVCSNCHIEIHNPDHIV